MIRVGKDFRLSSTRLLPLCILCLHSSNSGNAWARVQNLISWWLIPTLTREQKYLEVGDFTVAMSIRLFLTTIFQKLVIFDFDNSSYSKLYFRSNVVFLSATSRFVCIECWIWEDCHLRQHYKVESLVFYTWCILSWNIAPLLCRTDFSAKWEGLLPQQCRSKLVFTRIFTRKKRDAMLEISSHPTLVTCH